MNQEHLVSEFASACLEDQAKAERMIRKNPDLLRVPFFGREPVLNYMVVEGFVDAVEFLLKAGASPDTRDDSLGDESIGEKVGGKTALMLASSCGQLEIMTLLISAGADIEARSDFEACALFLAVLMDQCASVELLLRAGANGVDRRNGETVFYGLAPEEPQRSQMIEMLARYGVTMERVWEHNNLAEHYDTMEELWGP